MIPARASTPTLGVSEVWRQPMYMNDTAELPIPFSKYAVMIEYHHGGITPVPVVSVADLAGVGSRSSPLERVTSAKDEIAAIALDMYGEMAEVGCRRETAPPRLIVTVTVPLDDDVAASAQRMDAFLDRALDAANKFDRSLLELEVEVR